MQPTESVLASELRKFLNEYRYLFVLLVGLTVAFIAEPTLAQCVGWMCGPKTAITNNAVINGNGAAGVFIEFIFIAIQVLILLGLGALAVTFFYKMDRDENYVKPLIGLLVALLLIFGSNYVAGFVVGDSSTAGANTRGQSNPSGSVDAFN